MRDGAGSRQAIIHAPTAHSSFLFIIPTSNALSRMMVPRPATPEHLRLKLPASQRHNTHVVAHQLKASTTAALTFMYRSVIEKGHAMQIVDSTTFEREQRPQQKRARSGTSLSQSLTKLSSEINHSRSLCVPPCLHTSSPANCTQGPTHQSKEPLQAGGASRRGSRPRIFARWQVVVSWATWSRRVPTTTHALQD